MADMEATQCEDTSVGEEFLYNNLLGLQGLPTRFNFGQGIACLHVSVCTPNTPSPLGTEANESAVRV